MPTLRNYLPSDYLAVKKNLEEGDLFYDKTDTPEALQRKIERDPESIIVAEEEGEVVGNVFLVEDGWMPWIFRLAVRQDYQERGIGSLLMDEAERRLKARGYGLIGLFVNESHPDVQEWYQKRGHELGGLYRFMGKGL